MTIQYRAFTGERPIGVTLVSGAQSAVKQGRIVRLDGLGCGVPVELVLSVDGADDVRVKFVFR